MSGRKSIKEYISYLVKEIIIESKQSLMKLGFPEVVASLLSEKFGKNDFILAKWLKESKGSQFIGKDGTGSYPKDWWILAGRSFFSLHNDLDITDVVELYDAAGKSEEEYNRVRKELELSIGEDDEFDPANSQRWMKAEVSELLFSDIFFTYVLTKDIISKKITDIKPYKNLTFQQAKDKYDNIRIFDSKQAIKTYKNGWKWIDAGRRCQLVGKLMKNCGSTGVMSPDPDRTMLTLFDTNNKPHVVVTYSPNDKRISGDEGQAGSAAKEEYHDYILDLTDHLGAWFDEHRTKSSSLKLKSALKGVLKNIERLDLGGTRAEYKIELKNGQTFFTDTYSFTPQESMETLVGEFGSVRAAFDDISKDPRRYYQDSSTGIVSFVDFKKQLQPTS